MSKSKPTWGDVTEFAKAQIEKSRAELERWPQPPGLDNLHRGRIAALRDLLTLDSEVIKPSIPAPPSY